MKICQILSVVDRWFTYVLHVFISLVHRTVPLEWTFDAVFAPCTQRTDAECVASLVRFLPSHCIRWESWSDLTPWITSLILHCYIDCAWQNCCLVVFMIRRAIPNILITIWSSFPSLCFHLSFLYQKVSKSLADSFHYKVLLEIPWKAISAKLAHFMDQMSSPGFDRLTCKNCIFFTSKSHVACTHERSNFSFMFFMLINFSCPPWSTFEAQVVFRLESTLRITVFSGSRWRITNSATHEFPHQSTLVLSQGHKCSVCDT